METVLEDSTLVLGMQNSYFDFDNYNEPVDYFLDDLFYWKILPTHKISSDVFIRQGHAKTYDNYYEFFRKTEYKYYTATYSRDQLIVQNSTSKEFMKVYIRLDPEIEEVERQVYSIIKILAEIGGLFQSMFFIGIIIVGIFSTRLFVSSILRNIYQIDEITENCVKLQNIDIHKNKKESTTEREISAKVEPENSNDKEGGQHFQDRDSVHLSDVFEDGTIDFKEVELKKKAYTNTIHKLDTSEPTCEALK